MDSLPVKVCTQCGQTFPRTSEFWHRMAASRDGFRARCKACHYADNRAYIERNPEKVKAFLKRNVERKAAEYDAKGPPEIVVSKRCTRCEEVKSSGEFYVNKKADDGLNSHCKVCHYQVMLMWHEANPGAKGRYGRRRYQENLEEERWRSRIKVAAERADLHGAPGVFAAADVLAKLELQGHRCYYCGVRLVGFKFHTDHKVPFTRGGSNWPANICCACVSCNSRKHNKDFWEFSGKRRRQPFF